MPHEALHLCATGDHLRLTVAENYEKLKKNNAIYKTGAIL